MVVLTPTQRKVLQYIARHGYSENMHLKFGMKNRQQLSPYLRFLLSHGLIEEQPKYKAVKKGTI